MEWTSGHTDGSGLKRLVADEAFRDEEANGRLHRDAARVFPITAVADLCGLVDSGLGACHTLHMFSVVNRLTQASNQVSRNPWRRVPRVSLAVLILGLPVLLVAIVGIWASFSYRQAVHSIHADIQGVELDGVEVVEQRVDSCWNGLAPASVTVIRPIGPTEPVDVVADLRNAFEARGYVSKAPTAYTRPQRWTRERNDDLDYDIIELTNLPDSDSLQVVGDVYDVDMVFCPPF